jgi:hypothetical protein
LAYSQSVNVRAGYLTDKFHPSRFDKAWVPRTCSNGLNIINFEIALDARFKVSFNNRRRISSSRMSLRRRLAKTPL